MRCYICDSQKKTFKDREGKFICLDCRKSYQEEKLDGLNFNIDALVLELEERIPGLFHGVVCPGDCTCKCTYESGCELLRKELTNFIECDIIVDRGDR